MKPLLERVQAKSAKRAPSAAETGTSPTGSRNFGGMLVAPSYQAIPYGDQMNQAIVTVAADFNNDGVPDLATLDLDANINVLLNTGNAKFAVPVTTNAAVLVGSQVDFKAAVAVDLDGDGYPDLVASSKSVSTDVIYIFHNNHDATFSLACTIPVIQTTPYDVGSFLVADVTGDGVLDIVALSSVYDGVNSTITLQTFAGQPGGVFDPTHDIESSLIYTYYNIELPNDGALLKTLGGKLNLVFEAQAYDENTGGLTGVSVIALPVNGDGTFNTTPSAQVDFASSYGFVADNSGGLALADLNNDGIPDITLNFGDDYVYTALGNADGSFQSPVIGQAGFAINPSGWAVLDVDHDGYVDFVDYDDYYTTIWPGKGDGTFANPRYIYSTGFSNTGVYANYPGWNLAVADFNGDGLADLAIVDGSSIAYNRASVFIANGNGSFQGAPAVAPLDNRDIFPQSLLSLVAVDLNGDGKMDVLMLEQMGNPPFPFLAALSDGKGNFTYKKAMAGNAGGLNITYTSQTTGDFNGDGLQDVIFETVSGYWPNDVATLAVALSNGDGTLKTPVAIDSGSLSLHSSFSGISVADINSDGHLDIVAAYSGDNSNPAGFIVALGNGDGTFQPLQLVPYGNQIFGTALADFDGDGNVDLLLADEGSVDDPSLANVAIIYGDGSGNFDTTKAQVVNSGYYIETALVSDLDADGKLDLVLLSQGSTGGGYDPAGAGALVYLNQGNREFAPTGLYEAGRDPAAGMVADFNGDGIPDIFFCQYSPTQATADYYGSQILLGNGDGTFGSPFTAQVPPAVAILQPGDYLQDGAPDIVANSEYGAVIMLLNQGGTAIGLTASSPTITAGETEYVTATVVPTMNYRPVPSGTITLTENGVTVGSGGLTAGVATITMNGLAVGSHTLSANYSGDAAFNVNHKAATVAITVNPAPVIAPAISIQASTSSLTLKQGATGTVTLTIAANSTYSGSVSFATSGSLNGLKVQITPTQVTLSPGQAATATITVSTVAPNSAAMASNGAGWLGKMGATSLAGILGLLLPMRGNRRRRIWLMTICTIVLVSAFIGLAGCGSSSNYRVAETGTSTLVIQATPSVNGVSTQAVNITVIVE